MNYKNKVKTICDEITSRIENIHISCFKDIDKPLFLISEQYPGVWMEHVYDSVLLAQMDKKYLPIAENAINLFIDHQKASGQLPFAVMDGNKFPGKHAGEMIRFGHIQECVSFLTLALEVYELNKNKAFLRKIYNAGKKWNEWFRKYRMTSGRGLIEMFVGYDTGHDNSGRLHDMRYKGNYVLNNTIQNADILPADDEIVPVLAVDMNCNFYADEKALSKIASILGEKKEACHFEKSSEEIKKNLLHYCYDEEDAFFYDVDKNGNKRKFKSSTILHLFLEKVLNFDTDREIIERIYNEHLKNPDEFWTGYPFPSMAINDPSVEGHPDYNCWGYYTQGLIVLRCIRWMDDYGWKSDLDYILEKWIETWTNHYDVIKLAQEIDPVTGTPTKSSEWYSSCMLAYLYGSKRLNYI